MKESSRTICQVDETQAFIGAGISQSLQPQLSGTICLSPDCQTLAHMAKGRGHCEPMEHDPLGALSNRIVCLIQRRELAQHGIIVVRHLCREIGDVAGLLYQRQADGCCGEFRTGVLVEEFTMLKADALKYRAREIAVALVRRDKGTDNLPASFSVCFPDDSWVRPLREDVLAAQCRCCGSGCGSSLFGAVQ